MTKIRMTLKKSERFLVKNAVMTGSVFVVLILLLSVFLCWNFLKNDDTKTIKNIQDNLNNITNLSEQALLETYKKMSYIASNEVVELSFHKNMEKKIFLQRSVETKNILNTFKSFDEKIASVCVYSPYKKYVVTSDGTVPFDVYADKSWLSFYEDTEKNEAKMVFRKNSSGINVITFVYRAGKSENSDGGIIVDIDIEKHLKLNEDLYALILLDNSGEVIYKNKFGTEFLDSINGFDGEECITEYNNTYYAVCKTKSEIADFSYVLIENIPDYKSNRLFIYSAVFIVFLMLVISSFAVAVYIASYSYKPIREIAGIIENPSSEKSKKYLLNDSTTRKIADSIVMISANNKKLRDELNDRMGTLNYAQLKALQWQINPHFIFNTLNMMYYMIDEEIGAESRSAKGILSLSGIMRYSLKTEPMLVSLSEEIAYAEKYISLMNARLDNDFYVEWDIDKAFYDRKIVKMCLQPVLENCFQYSLKEIDKKGYIKISAKDENGFFCVYVYDNGKGMSDEKVNEIKTRLQSENALSDEHVGLANVHNRIVLISGKEYGVDLKSTLGEGTEVVLKFPYYRQEDL